MLVKRFLVIGLGSSALAWNVQNPDIVLPPAAAVNKARVVKLFQDSYSAYKKYAFPNDDLQPLSRKEGANGRNGWGATIVDSMSTMHIMGLNDLLAEAIEHSSKIDFSRSKTNDSVSVFETTIRYLGSLLSTYELTDGKYPVLLDKARELGDKLAFAWVNTTKIPFSHMNFTTDKAVIGQSNIAEAGTLALEFETLAKHTGNQTFFDLGVGALKHISTVPSNLPGLPPQGIDPITGTYIGGYITWGGGSDSYFEYLIKHARLSNTDDNTFADWWATAVDSSIRSLLVVSPVGNITYLADMDALRNLRYVGSHLACFHGGNWLFGGKLLNNQTIIDIGLKLIDGCWNTYEKTATGIGPESFGYAGPQWQFTNPIDPSEDDIAFYNKTGFYFRNEEYYLRPEVLESNFYAYRVTGDAKYLIRAEQALDSFIKYVMIRPIYGPAALEDVNNSTTPYRLDESESFWYAETLKYLIFDDPKHIHLDEWVFNTEAHPFKAPPAKSSYGSKTLRKQVNKWVNRPGPPLPRISAGSGRKGTPAPE